MNLLTLDIETSPHQADVWGLRDVNVGINQIRKSGGVLCWAAKWLDRPDDEVVFDSVNQSSRKHMLQHIHSLLSDADAVVGFNSKAFDCKHLNREFLLAGLQPPPPYKHVDLLTTMRRNFKFASNKLQYVSQALEIGEKTQHQGHGLWSLCEQGDQEAWALMRKYNMQDVLLTEKLYHRVLPWIGGQHPNRNNYDGAPEIRACPSCGGTHLQQRGFARTIAQRYRRFQCLDCGTWTRTAFSALNTREDRERILRAA